MWTAPAMCPLSHSSGSRTSISATSSGSGSGSSRTSTSGTIAITRRNLRAASVPRDPPVCGPAGGSPDCRMANLSDQPVRAARAPSRTVSRRALVVLTTAALAAAAGAAPAGASGGSGRAAGTSPVFPTKSSPAPSNVHRPCQLDEPTTAPPPARPKAPRRDVVAKNIDVPWGMVFLPGGGMLVGGRDTAKVLLVHKNGSRKVVRHMKGVDPNGNEGGEAGLLGLALAPNFKSSHWVYAYMSSSHDNRIVRMRWGHHRLGRQRLVLKGIPRSLHHNGGGLAF